jgi:ubiquinone biosynthesis protein
VKALHYVSRYREVATVLVRHGLGSFAAGFGLDRWVPTRQRIGGTDIGRPTSRAVHLRLALEELGPTFIKLGQLLSTRPDLLPPAYVAELSKLQDAAPPVPAEAVIAVVEEELGSPVDEVFGSFDPVPLASASIGQAHAATLRDGTPVVVKVRRPGVVNRINSDLEILQNLAAQAARHWRVAEDYNVVGIAGHFARALRAELDYLEEGRNADRFQEMFEGSSALHIPKVFWDTSTSRVLTLERITGVKIDDLPALSRMGVDGGEIIRRAVDGIAQMVFVNGFFHADPHPGNLFIEQDGRIGLIDFGMVGAISDPLRDRLTGLFLALTRADPEKLASALTRVCSTRRPINRDDLRADLAGFVALYQGRAVAQVDLGRLAGQLLAILRRHRLQLQAEIAMLVRMLVMVEGLGARLDPGFNLGESLQPYATRLAADRYSPAAIAERAARAGLETAAFTAELPEKLRHLFDILDTNGVEVHLRAAELDPLIARIERVGNRLVTGIIVAAALATVGQLASARTPRLAARRFPAPGPGIGVTLGRLASGRRGAGKG